MINSLKNLIATSLLSLSPSLSKKIYGFAEGLRAKRNHSVVEALVDAAMQLDQW